MLTLLITIIDLKVASSLTTVNTLLVLSQHHCNFVGLWLLDDEYFISSFIWPATRISLSQRLAEIGVSI